MFPLPAKLGAQVPISPVAEQFISPACTEALQVLPLPLVVLDMSPEQADLNQAPCAHGANGTA